MGLKRAQDTLEQTKRSVVQSDGCFGAQLGPLLTISMFEFAQDPYVTIRLENDRNEAGKIFRTTTKENSGKDATWNENFTIPYLKGFDKMRVEIWDANHMTKDEFLGFNEVFLRSTHGRGQGRPTEGSSRCC